MTCLNFGTGILCYNPIYKLRLEDGRHVWMEWHSFFGPSFYRDRFFMREIQDWYDDPVICQALDWFIRRGKIA